MIKKRVAELPRSGSLGFCLGYFDPSECDTSEKREALINYAKASYGL